MKRIDFKRIVLAIALMVPLFFGCSEGEEFMPDFEVPDVEIPEEEIPEEDIEIAVQNLERVEEAMSPLFLEAADANALGQRLEEIKRMEGVEEAYICDETTFAIKVKDGGKVYYYYPPEPVSVDFPEILDESSLRAAMTKADVCENKNVLIINQLSNDYRFEHALEAERTLEQAFIAKGFSVEIIHSEEFTAETLCEEMPKYGISFLMTHGGYDNTTEGSKNTHFLVTGEKNEDLKGERLQKWKQAWLRNEACALTVKNKTADGEWIKVKYVAVNELYLKKNIGVRFPENSILFNVACRSLYGNTDMWDVLKSKGLGCYLGLDGINSIGIDSGKYFFLQLLQGGTVSDAYDELSFWDKNQLLGVISLECHPSDCPITLFSEPEVTDVEAVDLGLSVKWRSMNLGATSYLDFGESYTMEQFDDIIDALEEAGYDDSNINLNGTEYDFATEKLGAGWRMPTIKEWEELEEQCEWKALVMENVPGFQVTGPNGNSIFLPCKTETEVMGTILFRSFYASGIIDRYVQGVCLVGNVTSIGMSAGDQEIMDLIWDSHIRPVCK